MLTLSILCFSKKIQLILNSICCDLAYPEIHSTKTSMGNSVTTGGFSKLPKLALLVFLYCLNMEIS